MVTYKIIDQNTIEKHEETVWIGKKKQGNEEKKTLLPPMTIQILQDFKDMGLENRPALQDAFRILLDYFIDNINDIEAEENALELCDWFADYLIEENKKEINGDEIDEWINRG